LLVTTFIEGSAPDYSPPSLRALGAALGRLHALCLSNGAALPLNIRLAGMRAAPEIAYAVSQLTGVDHLVPNKLQKRYDELLSALASVDSGECLPKVLIHNDCH